MNRNFQIVDEGHLSVVERRFHHYCVAALVFVLVGVAVVVYDRSKHGYIDHHLVYR